MSRRSSLILLIIALCALSAAFLWKFVWNKHTIDQTQTTADKLAVPYYLYMADAAGSHVETDPRGSVIIVQLPKTTYGEPISVTDAVGHALQTLRDDTDKDLILSFNLATSDVSVLIHNLKATSTDFSMNFSPVASTTASSTIEIHDSSH